MIKKNKFYNYYKYFTPIRAIKHFGWLWVLFVIYFIQGFKGITLNFNKFLIEWILLGWIMYSGIYMFNEWADIQEDITTSNKQGNHITRYQLNPMIVLFFSIFLILAGLISATSYNKNLLPFGLYLIFINITYSLYLKNLSYTLGATLIATTHITKILTIYAITCIKVLPLTFLFILYLGLISFNLERQIKKNHIDKKREYFILGLMLFDIFLTILTHQPFIVYVMILGIIIAIILERKFINKFKEE